MSVSSDESLGYVELTVDELIDIWYTYNDVYRPLSLFGKGLTKIPENLPDSLKILYLGCNNIRDIENVPDSVEVLALNENRIENFQNSSFPPRLRMLHCDSCELKCIDNLPDSITTLNITGNLELTEIKSLPKNLKHFYCGANFLLTSLPPLPPSLRFLQLCDTPISSLENILFPDSLKVLICSSHIPEKSIQNLLYVRVNDHIIKGNEKWRIWKRQMYR